MFIQYASLTHVQPCQQPHLAAGHLRKQLTLTYLHRNLLLLLLLPSPGWLAVLPVYTDILIKAVAGLREMGIKNIMFTTPPPVGIRHPTGPVSRQTDTGFTAAAAQQQQLVWGLHQHQPWAIGFAAASNVGYRHPTGSLSTVRWNIGLQQ
jgi:hypothetical protein